jgi:hypothetical protein
MTRARKAERIGGARMERQYSDAYKRWRRTSRCPICGRFIWYTRQFVNGQEHRTLRLGALDDPAAIEQCPRCDGRWFAYDQSRLVEVIELPNRITEVVAHQEIVMDNSAGTSPMLRTKTIGHEWTQAYEVTLEEASAIEKGIQIGKPDVATVSSMAKNALATTYHLKNEARKSYTEEIPFDVPPGIRQVVTLTFKRIWQCGVIKLLDVAGNPLEVPYKVAVDLEMDMTRQDM